MGSQLNVVELPKTTRFGAEVRLGSDWVQSLWRILLWTGAEDENVRELVLGCPLVFQYSSQFVCEFMKFFNFSGFMAWQQGGEDVWFLLW